MSLPKFWTEADFSLATNAKDYRELSVVGLRVLHRVNDSNPFLQTILVCGPLTTGGLGSPEKNLAAFQSRVEYLEKSGAKVFNQMPFEEHLWRISSARGKESGLVLLGGFYLPLLESGHIHAMLFIPGWEGSFGASWEHEQAERLRIQTVYMPKPGP